MSSSLRFIMLKKIYNKVFWDHISMSLSNQIWTFPIIIRRLSVCMSVCMYVPNSSLWIQGKLPLKCLCVFTSTMLCSAVWISSAPVRWTGHSTGQHGHPIINNSELCTRSKIHFHSKHRSISFHQASTREVRSFLIF